MSGVRAPQHPPLFRRSSDGPYNKIRFCGAGAGCIVAAELARSTGLAVAVHQRRISLCLSSGHAAGVLRGCAVRRKGRCRRLADAGVARVLWVLARRAHRAPAGLHRFQLLVRRMDPARPPVAARRPRARCWSSRWRRISRALAYFKYADFFLRTAADLSGADIPLLGVVLPLGISFFTFTQIAYLVDVHAGKVRRTQLRPLRAVRHLLPAPDRRPGAASRGDDAAVPARGNLPAAAAQLRDRTLLPVPRARRRRC